LKQKKLTLLEETSNDDTVISSTMSPGDALKILLQIAASTGRGEFAKPTQRKEAKQLITVLELNNPISELTNSNFIYGKWELLYSSTQLFHRGNRIILYLNQ
jgi:hypothetical protein